MRRDRGLMHYRELTEAVLEAGEAESSSATPEASLNAVIAVDIKRKGNQRTFVGIRPGVFRIRGVHRPGAIAAGDGETAASTEDADATDERVRIPLFPLYAELRHVLRVWPGRRRRQVTGLRATVNEPRGTPQ